MLLVFAALLLSRMLHTLAARRLRLIAAAYLSLMLTYGVGNLANDFWFEQIVKPGRADWRVPSVLEPGPTWGWAVVAAGAVAVFALWFGRERD